MLQSYKILLSLVVIIFLFAKPVTSQNLVDKHHFEFSIGEPLSSVWGFNGMFADNMKEHTAFDQWAGKSRPYTLPSGVNGYEDEWIIPTFSLSYYYQPLKWLEVGG